MKRNFLKLISCLLCFAVVFSFCFVLADSNDFEREQLAIKNISNRVLNIVMWFGYAIAFGCLIFFGIKYMLSGADEKASLKGMLPKYLIGLVAILFCFTIASFVAGIAGSDTADEIIKVGEEAGEHFTGIIDNEANKTVIETNDVLDDRGELRWRDFIYSDGTSMRENYSGGANSFVNSRNFYDNKGNRIKTIKYDEEGKVISTITY